MRRAGIPESVIIRITSHSTKEMFDRYNTIDLQDTAEAVDRLQKYLESINISGQELKKRD